MRCHHSWKGRQGDHLHWCMNEEGGHVPPCECDRCDAEDWCTAHPTLTTDEGLTRVHYTVRPSRIAVDLRIQGDGE